jgi:hypothetical protein
MPFILIVNQEDPLLVAQGGKWINVPPLFRQRRSSLKSYSE